jgi:tetratricopeptide (TPR) repeat protein
MASSARIEELEKKFNENPRRYFAPLANEYRKAGDVQQAIAICRTYVPQQPGHMSGHIVFGQALFEAGDHDEARGVFEAALGLDPENLIALRHLGDIAREHGESDDARAWYRRVLEADPRNDEVAALLTSVEAEQAAAADEPATWTEINPEQTLELPPDILAAVPRDIGFAKGASPRPPASSMGELFGGGVGDLAPTPDTAGGETLEFRPPAYAAPEGAGYVDEAARTVPTFVTETMAELYVQQGFYDQALSVYRELLTQHPGDPKLAERMEQLRRESAATPPRPAAQPGSGYEVPPAAHSAPEHRSVREFFSELALRQPKARGAAPGDAARAVASHAAAEPDHAAPIAPDESTAASASAPVAPAEAGEPVAAEAVHETAEALPAHDESLLAAEPETEAAADDTTHLPRDLDAGFSDASYHESYGAEFGASALTVPDDDAEDDGRAGPGLFVPRDQPSDSLVVRPSGEADPFALLGFGAANEASEFDVTAFEASTVPASHGDPATGIQESPPDQPNPVAGADAGAAPGTSGTGTDDAAVRSESQPVPFAEPASRGAMQTGSVNVLFPERPISAPDEAAAAALSSAFGGPSFQPELSPAAAGAAKPEPKPEGSAEAKNDVSGASGSARPALNELSLDSVFREAPSASPDPRREPSAFSFDQFFGETPPAASGGTSGTDSLLGDSLDVGSADAEQFSNWLSGLKKK